MSIVISEMEDNTGKSETFSVQQLLKARPSNVHMGSKGSSDSCDISDMIDKSGCAQEYYALEECLGEHDRRWAKCQVEVKALQQCSAKPKEVKKH